MAITLALVDFKIIFLFLCKLQEHQENSQLQIGLLDFVLDRMDLQLVEKGLLGYTWKRKRLVAMLAAIVFSTYAAYRVCHLPSIEKRKRFSKVLGALISIAEVIYDSAETVGIISKDLKDFLQSEFDQIPNSFKQISKVASARIDHDSSANANPSFLDKVFDKLSTPVGGLNSNSDLNDATATTSNHVCSEMNSVRELVDVVCSHKCKELISDCIQLFVSSAVAVYLDKTMHINTYDEIFAGLTNPKPENEVRANSKQEFPNLRIDQEEDSPENEEHKSKPKTRMSFDEVEDGGWVRKGSSTLAITSNRRLVLGVTGRITFEMDSYLIRKMSIPSFATLYWDGEIIIDGEGCDYCGGSSTVITIGRRMDFGTLDNPLKEMVQ
ncbi:hypothetical protein GH714_033257 [Hevea brasiliensis]|uniref:Uncharacterized protein n=1 Tax=Hevea brasiliensis TaxID=3981 RepID=A0A6A6L579_HEVBR|nr:hypothetical protein GH714_033257 [Hevea brasiliensis]